MARSKTLLGFGVNDLNTTVKWKTSCGVEFCLPEYRAWKGMIVRCYGKMNEKKESYRETIVDERWRSLSCFKDWFDYQKYEHGFVLDKDLLGDGSIYSPEVCCLIPPEINGFLIGVHKTRGYHKRGNSFEACLTKGRGYVYLGTFSTREEAYDAYITAKSNYAKELAVKYKDQIDSRAYEALVNFSVKI